MVRLKKFSLWCLISIVVLAIVHVSAPPTHAEVASTSEEGWIQNPTNGHYYKLTDPMNWSQAEEQAIQWGGHLVTVNDADENEWLVSTFGGVEELWIGYTDKDIEGDWRWISGEDSTFTNWVYHNSGCGVWEPNDSPPGEDFAAMNWNRPIGYEGPCYAPDHAPGKWNDLPISSIARGIVEISNRPLVASFNSLNVVELGNPDEETFDGGHMVGGVIRFDPTASYDPEGEIKNYEWNFDNGITFSTNQPNIYDITFEEARVYNVSLTVTDNFGSMNTYTEPLDLTLKDGDLIFIRTAWWDIPFNIVLNEYTHVGMYIGGQWMIESILTENPRSNSLAGVVVTPLSGWSYPSETFATLVRVITANDRIRENAVGFALSKLGQGYDLNVWSKSVNKPNYYCSELIWAAYYKASKGRINLGNKKRGGVWPDDIMNDTVNTRVIGYHHEHHPL